MNMDKKREYQDIEKCSKTTLEHLQVFNGEFCKRVMESEKLSFADIQECNDEWKPFVIYQIYCNKKPPVINVTTEVSINRSLSCMGTGEGMYTAKSVYKRMDQKYGNYGVEVLISSFYKEQLIEELISWLEAA